MLINFGPSWADPEVGGGRGEQGSRTPLENHKWANFVRISGMDIPQEAIQKHCQYPRRNFLDLPCPI